MQERTVSFSKNVLGIVVMMALWGCGSGSGSAPSGSAEAPPGSSGAPAASKGNLIHHKITKNECTFEFDAPEQLKEQSSQPTALTYRGTSFEVVGFSGTSFQGLSGLVSFSQFGGAAPIDVQETANKIHLVVTHNEKKVDDPVRFVSGHGEEAEHGDRSLGCSFLCWGAKDRLADTIALCRSVRVTYSESK